MLHRMLLIVDPCAEGTLNSGAACFTQLSRHDRDAAIVWYLWQAVQNCAGFSSDIDVLLQAGSCFTADSEEMLHAMEVVIAGETAADAGAGVTVTLAEVVDGIKCLKFADAQKLRALKVLLSCKLSGCINPIT